MDDVVSMQGKVRSAREMGFGDEKNVDAVSVDKMFHLWPAFNQAVSVPKGYVQAY